MPGIGIHDNIKSVTLFKAEKYIITLLDNVKNRLILSISVTEKHYFRKKTSRRFPRRHDNERTFFILKNVKCHLKATFFFFFLLF